MKQMFQSVHHPNSIPIPPFPLPNLLLNNTFLVNSSLICSTIFGDNLL